MEKSKNQEQLKDEIDLTALIKFFFNGIVNLLNNVFLLLIKLLIVTRKFIIKRILFLVIAIVVGGILGYIYGKFTSPLSETSLTIESPFLKGYDFIYEIEKLNEYFIDKNYDRIVNLFEASEEEILPIKSIVAKTYLEHYDIFEKYGEIAKSDSLKVAREMNSSLFIINIKLSENDIVISKIETWLKNYLSNNKVLVKSFNARRNVLLHTKEKLLIELSSIDSLKKGVNKRILSNNILKNQSPSSLEISVQDEKDIFKNPINLYEKDLALFTQLQNIQRELSLLEEVTIINGVKSIKENKEEYVKSKVIWGLLIGFLSVCFIFLMLALNDFIIEFEKKLDKK